MHNRVLNTGIEVIYVSTQDYNFCPRCGGKLLRQFIGDRDRFRCSECDNIVYQNPVPAVGGLLVQDGNVLLVRRGVEPRKSMWSLPAGFMEYGESPEETLNREILEETNLQIINGKFFRLYSVLDDPRYHCILIIFTVDEWEGEEAPGDDVSELRWFALDNLPEDMAFQTHCEVIKQYIREIGHSGS